jgi:hypothetical protein
MCPNGELNFIISYSHAYMPLLYVKYFYFSISGIDCWLEFMYPFSAYIYMLL